MTAPAHFYDADRVRRIRIALGVAMALGMVTGVIAVLVATLADDPRRYPVVLGVVAVGAIVGPVISWRLLDAPTSAAKRAVIITGALLIAFALVTIQVAVGLLFVVLGLVLIFLATISEADAGT